MEEHLPKILSDQNSVKYHSLGFKDKQTSKHCPRKGHVDVAFYVKFMPSSGENPQTWWHNTILTFTQF
jgi:hypothetical protein